MISAELRGGQIEVYVWTEATEDVAQQSRPIAVTTIGVEQGYYLSGLFLGLAGRLKADSSQADRIKGDLASTTTPTARGDFE